jgi:hypothetical protein
VEAVEFLAEYRALLEAQARAAQLRAGDNPCLELMTLLLAAPREIWPALDMEERRRELASLFSWGVPNEGALQVLAAHAPLVECGAGMGYWSALLRARGVDVLAYDAAPPGKSSNNYHRFARQPWTTVNAEDSVLAARGHGDRTLFLCWPPFDDDHSSYAVLRAYGGDKLVFVGEGATGSVRFHRELAVNWSLEEEVRLPNWPRLRDTLMVYRRNAVRRPLRERDRCFECHRFIPTGAIGRCDWCFSRKPTALALQVGKHRVEYPQQMLDAMPAEQRRALEESPNRINAKRS